MNRYSIGSPLAALGAVSSAVLIALLVLPVIALGLSSSGADIQAAFAHPLFLPALGLSLRTTAIALVITVLLGTPLAWWLASSSSSAARSVSVLVELPVIIPPAVMGVALLQTFGRRGLFGPWLLAAGLEIPFTAKAVVLAQVVVSSPFFVQAAANAFRKVDPDMLLVARTLGATPTVAFLRVALPIARPGLVAGASLAWARALGEFGATLLFAGNLRGRTQTMPLAIFSALESDVRVAVVFALCLAGIGAGLLLILRIAGTMTAPRPLPAFSASDPRALARAPVREGSGRLSSTTRSPPPQYRLEATMWRAAVKGRLGPVTLDVDVEGGRDIVALIGPNGSGKTTFLRALAGAVDLPNVEVEVGDRVLASRRRSIHVPIERRRLGYLPQGYGLFPHLSVLDNVAFGLSVGPTWRPRVERRRRARQLLAELECEALLDRPVAGLSGGEQQRVALARALAVEPMLLLLDEPLAALDVQARRAIRPFLADRLQAFSGPCIFVTHDLRDVVALDATVIAVEAGRVVQRGRLEALKAAPATAFVAEFVAAP